MASSEPYPEPYLAAIHCGFQFARELGCRCGTVHLLVGISEGHDQAAAALAPRQGPPLREAVAAAGDAFGDGAAWLGNRWVSVRDRWFRLRTLGSYRHAPQP
jgi:hypothetical protein